MSTLHLLIKGKVQGVYYRASAKDKAVALGLSGWVKNTVEGNVEALVSGDDEDLNQFADWCRTGPPDAFVTAVEIRQVPDEKFEGFRIVRGG